MDVPLPVQSGHFRPWRTMWFHPRQTIQEIVDVNPLHRLYLLVLLSGIASGLGDWLNAVMTDSDTFQENALLAVGFGLVVGTGGTLLVCLVLQWITVWSGARIPYSHLAAASFWGTIPGIGFLLLFVVAFAGGMLAAIVLPSAVASAAWLDWLLWFAWFLSSIWTLVLTIGALSQVMRCSVGATIGRQIAAGLAAFVPTWALTRLFSYFGDRFSGDIVLYYRAGTEAGTDLESMLLPVAALVVSLVVILVVQRAAQTKSAAASLNS